MSSLPVAAILPELLEALVHSPQILLHAPTGAGKSTWLPLQILQQGHFSGRILLLEPRRIAARNVAERMASLLGEKVGETVGYRMRLETCVSRQTRLEVVTEGILTRLIQQDPELTGVDLVILDEFHERSLQADLALALLLDLQSALRDDLRVLIMSATLDKGRLEQLLPDAPTLRCEGRTFSVERRYHPLPPELRQEEAIAIAVNDLLRKEPGSLLLFLPGVSEIKRVQRQLESRVAKDVLLCPLYGALSLAQQRQAIAPAAPGMRKLVLATNIAETSLTIEGIRLVVDATLERVARYDARSGLTRLVTQRISQASMLQRAGRAGRLAPGICLHLLSSEQAERAAPQSSPEIVNSALEGMLLELLYWGCRDINQLQWLDTPPVSALAAAQRLLHQLGAVDDQGQLTPHGRGMAQMGCEPRLASLLLRAQGRDAQTTAARLVALLEERNSDSNSDVRLALENSSSTQRQRMEQLIKRLGITPTQVDMSLILPLVARSFADRIARRRGIDGRYQLANGAGAMLSHDDGLQRHEWLIALQLQQSDGSTNARILQALPCDINQLLAQCPELVSHHKVIEWDKTGGELKALARQQIGKLVIQVRPLEKLTDAEMQRALIAGIREQGLACLTWSEAADQLRLRLECAKRWLPELPWPAVDDEHLLAQLEHWLLPEMGHVRSLSALKRLDVAKALLNLLDWPLRQRLDSGLPTHYTVPTGSRIAIRYSEDNPPVLGVRMQEMFGESQTPVIAEGRIPLVLELLSPAGRPLQITQDLNGFWQGAYLEVKKEMKGRYPKHVWPDDPGSASPTRRTKKYQQV